MDGKMYVNRWSEEGENASKDNKADYFGRFGHLGGQECM